MNILHLLSQLEITGAEAYAISLAEEQIEGGHRVSIISDKLHLPTRALYHSQAISRRNLLQRFKNVTQLRKYVRENEIDVVHAHSRAASWVAYAALWGTGIPLISTVHGRQHLHKNWRKKDIYGDRVIAVCENIAIHLQNEMGIDPDKISVIRNGLNLGQPPAFNPLNATPVIAVAGRSSGPKGKRTEELVHNVFPQILERLPQLKIHIFGGDPKNFSTDLFSKIQDLNKKYPEAITLLGSVNHEKMLQEMQASTCVIASGRTAMTSLWLEKPTIALGEAHSHGLVKQDNLASCLESNFGDIWPSKISPEIPYPKITKELLELLQEEPWSAGLSKTVAGIFDTKKISARVFQQYIRAIAKRSYPAHIPVLMFHKVTDTPLETKHKIYVTKEVFSRQMASLHKQGFTPITFKQYQDFRQGTLGTDFPQKPIFLTFDDCYLDNFQNAIPILDQYQFKAVFFALGDKKIEINSWDWERDKKEPISPLMKDEHLQALLKGGHEIGAHSMTHRDLTKLAREQRREEILQSKLSLEERLQTSVISFAYPYGCYDKETKADVEEMGFAFAVTTDGGGLHLEDDPYAIFRVSIFPQDLESQIKKKSSSWYRRYYSLKRGR